MFKASAVISTIAVLAFAGPVIAEEMSFQAELTGAQQVPPVETDAMGTVEVTFDTGTMMLSWTLEYEELSGEVTAAHFHGPADKGETAPPVIPATELASGSEESVEITEEQAELLRKGQLYFNVHTAENPGGEIRGQVMDNCAINTDGVQTESGVATPMGQSLVDEGDEGDDMGGTSDMGGIPVDACNDDGIGEGVIEGTTDADAN